MIFPSLSSLRSWRDFAPIDAIVAINGCFDILHPGHLELVRFAFEDCFAGPVIVGVNSDRSVKAAKGPGRPVNSCEQRMKTILGLRWVTHAVEFDEATPIEFLKACRPHVWAVGGKYCVDSVDQACAAAVLRSGGKIKFSFVVPGYSSTAIINRL